MAAIIPTNTGPTSATHAAAVTPSNSQDLAYITKGLWIGGVGDLKVTMYGGDVVTFSSVAAGTYLRIAVSRVWADSTATSIIAIWE